MNNPPPSETKAKRHSARPARLCSRLERSPWQRAVPDGLVGRSEGCQTTRRFGYEQCTGYGKPGVRFSRQVDPLQIETAVASPGTLSWTQKTLCDRSRPQACEAASDAQKPPPQVPTDSRRRGRPKDVTKCYFCRKSKLECGASCTRRPPGLSPIALAATPAQLPALAAAAGPLLSAVGAHAELAQAQTPSLPPSWRERR